MRPVTAGFLLYSRPGCGLCEEMLAELQALPAAHGFTIELADVATLVIGGDKIVIEGGVVSGPVLGGLPG